MSKKRQDLELELRKLDIDRRDVDVRIRSIEQSPRNQRILRGDFSRPPPRVGDTRKFARGRGSGETEDTPTKRPREGEESAKEEAVAPSEKEKDEEKGDDEKEEESVPSVLSAVVVNEEPEPKEETAKPERGKRKLAGGAEISKRDKRIFSSLLMGHLNQAQNRLKVDRDSANIKKKEELEAKVSQKISQRTVGIREKEAEHLAEQRDQEKKLRNDIVRKEEIKRRELDELIILEHEENLSNFIRTQTEPFVYYLPASHTDKTKKLLAKTKEMHDARIADGSAMLEKDLDQGFIDELFKGEENTGEKPHGEDATKGKDSEKGDKKKDKDEDQSKKDAEKEKKARDDSPPKKSRKKAKEESSSSSSDSSDSD